MPDSQNFNFFQAMMNPQFASQQLQIQRQQALAQQMMDEGSQQPATAQLANPGGQVIVNSPAAALGRALEKGVGGYMQGRALADQMRSYQGLAGQQTADQSPDGQGGAPLLPWQNNAVTGQPQGQALANGIMGGGSVTGDAMHDPQFMHDAMIAGVDNAYKGYLERTKPTDLQKNVTNAATQPYVAKEALVNTAGGYVPATSLMSSGGNSSPSPAITGANTSKMSPQGNGGQVVLDNSIATKNDPALQEQRKGLISGDQKYLNETLLPAKDAALAANNNIGALQQAATIANGNDLTHTGPTAPARLGFIKHLNDFLSSTGGQPIDSNEIANADAINKIGLRLTANMTKMLGSREAAQIFSKIQEANPNWYMQPQTLNLVSNLIKGENDTAIAKYDAGFKEATKPGGLAQNGVNAFDAQNPGMANVKKAFSASGMAGIDNPQSPEFQQLPSGSQFYDLIPNSPTYGKLLTKH